MREKEEKVAEAFQTIQDYCRDTNDRNGCRACILKENCLWYFNSHPDQWMPIRGKEKE